MTRYTIAEFIRDAKAVLATPRPLEEQKEAIGAYLQVLSRRDDLTRFAQSLGPSDSSTHSYLLWREKPYTVLTLAQFDPGYLSPVHDHGDFWVVACGYRGIDRWDMYERVDDGSRTGHADLRMVDQFHLPVGKAVWMPPPPRAIHSHNNTTTGLNMVLVFTAATPQTPEQRLIFDVEAGRCWPSPWDMGKRRGDNYPPLAATAASTVQPVRRRLFSSLRGEGGAVRRRWFGCPACLAMA